MNMCLEVLGRTGEAKPDRPVQLTIKHQEFRESIPVLLKSDPRGRIRLGALTDISTITASGPEGTAHTWTLPLNRHTYRQVIHAQAGEVIAVPYLGTLEKPIRTDLALFEMRGTTIYSDRFDALSLKDGMVEIAGLTPGDYDLFLKTTGDRIRIRVVDGKNEAGYVLGKLRHLELSKLKPVQVANITTDDENVTIRLRDFSTFTRVHVYGTRYMPAFSAFADLGRVRDIGLAGQLPFECGIALSGRSKYRR